LKIDVQGMLSNFKCLYSHIHKIPKIKIKIKKDEYFSMMTCQVKEQKRKRWGVTWSSKGLPLK
jgi:hypothetical protein